jgi:hypothetical protein
MHSTGYPTCLSHTLRTPDGVLAAFTFSRVFHFDQLFFFRMLKEDRMGVTILTLRTPQKSHSILQENNKPIVGG